MYSVTNNRGFVPQSEQFEDREMIGEDIKAYIIIHKNDFAYNPARINVGSIAKYNGDNPCMISSLYVCFKACNRVDSDWLMQLLKTPRMNFYYNTNGEGGVRVYLFYPNFSRISTSLPIITEQKKIAKFLSLLDERIATQNKIIEKLETLIKGIIETVISSQKPNTLIKNCLECNSSTLQESQVAENGNFPVYGATGISGYTETADINGESILIIKDGSGVGTVKFVTGEYSYIGTLNSLTVKDGYCLKYIYFALQGFSFDPYKTGMAIPHIYFKDYGKAKIYCPPYKLQTIISQQLTYIESKIDVEKRILSNLARQKSYLLSQMFI